MNQSFESAQRRMELIRQFAAQMGYEVHEVDYGENYRPCHSIELIGTEDSGYAFTWTWYCDTWEECNQ